MTTTEEISARHLHHSRSYFPSAFRSWEDEGSSQPNDLSDDSGGGWTTNSDAEEKTRQDYYDNHNYQGSGVPTRTCSDCNTTKTPLWRSGPRGPKSLCNACGIRLRKARRAEAAALNGELIPIVSPSKVRKDKGSDYRRNVPLKKRCRLTSDQTRTSLVFEDFAVGSGKRSAYRSIFHQDEKEAALLLMALSSGLIRS